MNVIEAKEQGFVVWRLEGGGSLKVGSEGLGAHISRCFFFSPVEWDRWGFTRWAREPTHALVSPPGIQQPHHQQLHEKTPGEKHSEFVAGTGKSEGVGPGRGGFRQGQPTHTQLQPREHPAHEDTQATHTRATHPGARRASSGRRREGCQTCGHVQAKEVSVGQALAVQDVNDKPWRNAEPGCLEEGVPRLKEDTWEKAAAMGVGCDGFYTKVHCGIS